MMSWYSSGRAWWEAGLMWVVMLAFWAVIICAIYLTLAGVARHDVGESADRARRILDERLARGEIDTDDYRSRVDVLTLNNRTPTSAGGQR